MGHEIPEKLSQYFRYIRKTYTKTRFKIRQPFCRHFSILFLFFFASSFLSEVLFIRTMNPNQPQGYYAQNYGYSQAYPTYSYPAVTPGYSATQGYGACTGTQCNILFSFCIILSFQFSHPQNHTFCVCFNPSPKLLSFFKALKL